MKYTFIYILILKYQKRIESLTVDGIFLNIYWYTFFFIMFYHTPYHAVYVITQTEEGAI